MHVQVSFAAATADNIGATVTQTIDKIGATVTTTDKIGASVMIFDFQCT